MKKIKVFQFPRKYVFGDHFSKCISAEGRRLDTTPSFRKSWKYKKSWISKIWQLWKTKWSKHGVHKVAQCVSGHFCLFNPFPIAIWRMFLFGTSFSKIVSKMNLAPEQIWTFLVSKKHNQNYRFGRLTGIWWATWGNPGVNRGSY